ncbi:T9SS type A sorting domain-containing protein [Flavobacterium sp. RSB2_4_14]|uniref:T9SS type A sorting domain-containing protein n=1 Tax=Flavobacterium sp. RSB2_4_14 TaxID=3447665 RepID=UPI003F2A95F6
MKKLLLSFLLVGGLSANAQILTETFQGTTFPPTGWTTETNVASRPWGFTTVIFNASGQTTFNITDGKSAGIGWIAQDQDAHLTSPSFSLVGYSSATLTFNAKIGYEYMVAPFANGNLFVKVSTDGGSTWTTLWTEEAEGVYVDYATLAVELDLTPYVGQSNVQIRYQYVANDADSLSIDDFLVDGTLGISDFLSNKFSTYPNPATSLVNISNTSNILLTNVNITDINGRIVKTMKVNNLTEVQMNIGELNSGVYIMNIDTDSGKVVKKIIKN